MGSAVNIDSLIQTLMAVAGVYAAIRADIAYTRAKAEQAAANSARAHKRLDDHINLHHVQ